jgi:hypothetical protein
MTTSTKKWLPSVQAQKQKSSHTAALFVEVNCVFLLSSDVGLSLHGIRGKTSAGKWKSEIDLMSLPLVQVTWSSLAERILVSPEANKKAQGPDKREKGR